MTSINRDEVHSQKQLRKPYDAEPESPQTEGMHSHSPQAAGFGYEKSAFYPHEMYPDCDRFGGDSSLGYGFMGIPKIARELKRKAKKRICSNCSTTSTPSWRRGDQGKSLLCNACGLYQKLHGRTRPYTMTSAGKTKALKGHEGALCISCSSPCPDARPGPYMCSSCMAYVRSQKSLEFYDSHKQMYGTQEYYRYDYGCPSRNSIFDRCYPSTEPVFDLYGCTGGLSKDSGESHGVSEAGAECDMESLVCEK